MTIQSHSLLFNHAAVSVAVHQFVFTTLRAALNNRVRGRIVWWQFVLNTFDDVYELLSQRCRPT